MQKDFYCQEVLSGNIKVEILKETEHVLAFMHTQPTWEFHAVIIPKVHVVKLTDVQNVSLVGEILQIARDIINEKGFNQSNYKIITNGGSYQSTQHLHFHLVSGKPLDPNSSAQSGELRV